MLGIFLDIETNGLDPNRHCPIEIAYKIIEMVSGKEYDRFESIISLSEEEWEKSDPESIKITGFSQETLRLGKEKQKVGSTIFASFQKQKIQRGKAVFICQNPSFDRAFFYQLCRADIQEKSQWPYHWLDLASMHWSKQLQNRSAFPWQTGITKNQIASFYGLPKEERPHRAMNGVNHLLLCYEQVVGFPIKK